MTRMWHAVLNVTTWNELLSMSDYVLSIIRDTIDIYTKSFEKYIIDEEYCVKYRKRRKIEETELRYTDRGPIPGDPQSVYPDVSTSKKCKWVHDLY